MSSRIVSSPSYRLAPSGTLLGRSRRRPECVSRELLERAGLLRRELMDFVRDAFCAELADRVRERIGGELPPKPAKEKTAEPAAIAGEEADVVTESGSEGSQDTTE